MGIRHDGAARILVADDEAAIRNSYASIFDACPKITSDKHSALEAELFGAAENASSDFEVCLCHCGAEAVAAMQKAVEAGSPFEVAFLDVRMPPGIDGVKAAERIRAIDPDISIVMVTGYSDVPVEQIAERVKPAGKLLVRHKPLQASEILQLAQERTKSGVRRVSSE